MKRKQKILVLTDHMPWGHRSIAKAIYGFLKKNQKDFEVEYREVEAETLVGNSFYTFSYRFSPGLGRLMYKSGFKKSTYDMIKNLSKLGQKRLIKVVNQTKPDLIISSYYLHSHCLQYLRQEMNFSFKLWTIVADPWTINPISFIKEVDLNIVYDEVGVKQGRKLGVSSKKMLATGWWTRGEMYLKYDQKQARKKLGFNDDRPIIFVGGGSLGSNMMAKILPNLLFVRKKVGFIFNTGTDKLAFTLIKEYVSLVKKLKLNKYVDIKIFSWIDNMAEMLSASDLVFGKAGPNFLFEVVACQKPFVSITHIGGQEDGNIELIRKKRLGWVRENSTDLSKFLLKFLKNPTKYKEKYSQSIKKEALKNQKSMNIILKRLEKDLQR